MHITPRLLAGSVQRLHPVWLRAALLAVPKLDDGIMPSFSWAEPEDVGDRRADIVAALILAALDAEGAQQRLAATGASAKAQEAHASILAMLAHLVAYRLGSDRKRWGQDNVVVGGRSLRRRVEEATCLGDLVPLLDLIASDFGADGLEKTGVLSSPVPPAIDASRVDRDALLSLPFEAAQNPLGHHAEASVQPFHGLRLDPALIRAGELVDAIAAVVGNPDAEGQIDGDLLGARTVALFVDLRDRVRETPTPWILAWSFVLSEIAIAPFMDRGTGIASHVRRTALASFSRLGDSISRVRQT